MFDSWSMRPIWVPLELSCLWVCMILWNNYLKNWISSLSSCKSELHTLIWSKINHFLHHIWSSGLCKFVGSDSCLGLVGFFSVPYIRLHECLDQFLQDCSMPWLINEIWINHGTFVAQKKKNISLRSTSNICNKEIFLWDQLYIQARLKAIRAHNLGMRTIYSGKQE